MGWEACRLSVGFGLRLVVGLTFADHVTSIHWPTPVFLEQGESHDLSSGGVELLDGSVPAWHV